MVKMLILGIHRGFKCILNCTWFCALPSPPLDPLKGKSAQNAQNQVQLSIRRGGYADVAAQPFANRMARFDSTKTITMKRQNQFKKQAILLFFAGTLCMSFTLLTRHFFETPIDVDDFLKGLGVAFIVSALFVQKKLEKKTEY